MIIRSPLPQLDIPKVDILTYLFPDGETVPDTPIWHDADDPTNNLSIRQLFNWVKRLIIGLDRLGIGRNEIVLIYSPNHIFIPVAYLGIVGGSRVFSAVNPIYTVDEVVHQLNNSGAKAILAHPSMLNNALAAAQKAGLPQDKIFQFDDRPCPPQAGVKDWREMIGTPQEAETFQWKRLQGEAAVQQIATINYSSGTTGLPKGVCVSHHNLVANVMQTVVIRFPGTDIHHGQYPTQRWVGFLPLYHAYGQLYANLIAVKARIPIFVMRAFVYEQFLRVVQDQRITNLQVAPPVLVMMSKRPETTKYDLSSIDEILCGAAPLSRELQNDISRRFKCDVKQGWGMTEVTCSGILETEAADTGTVGKLCSNTEIKLIDDDGKEVGYDTPGEIYIRGPNVCLGYFKNDKATQESLDKDGWLKSGDVAVCNKDGLFWIVDRKKEMIKVNALQVAPAELEAVLLENDDVADAAVVGITVFNEEFPRAYITLTDSAKGKVTEKQIQDWIKTKVAKHKQLVGGVRFIDEVPKLASGKIQRKVMRDWAKKDAPEVEKQLGSNHRSKL